MKSGTQGIVILVNSFPEIRLFVYNAIEARTDGVLFLAVWGKWALCGQSLG